jgi:hypothetical protein
MSEESRGGLLNRFSFRPEHAESALQHAFSAVQEKFLLQTGHDDAYGRPFGGSVLLPP